MYYVFQQFYRHMITGRLFVSLMMQKIGLKGMKYYLKKTILNLYILQRLTTIIILLPYSFNSFHPRIVPTLFVRLELNKKKIRPLSVNLQPSIITLQTFQFYKINASQKLVTLICTDFIVPYHTMHEILDCISLEAYFNTCIHVMSILISLYIATN